MPAFDLLDCELHGTQLIEASAGTGKTWTLCGLYLRLLLERGLDVQQILVVTFTHAATAELRERIRSRIAETLAQLRGHTPAGADPFVGTLLQRLRTQPGLAEADMALRLDLALESFDEATIFTIHGFCQRALGDMPFATGMPMDSTRLTDDSEMRLTVVQDFWRRHIAGGSLSPALVDHLLDKKDAPQSLSKLLGRSLAKPLSRPLWPEALDAPIDLPEAALAVAHTAASDCWATQRTAIVDIVTEALPRLNANSYNAEKLQQAAAEWDELLAHPGDPGSPAGLGRLDLLRSTKLKVKKGQAALAPHEFFELADQLLVLHAARDEALVLQRLRLLRELLEQGPAALRKAKREQRVIAFDDMLANLHRRLIGPDGAALATALRTRHAAALIDEFQDTDPLQYAIFRAIYASGAAPLCFVGDPKQAIYSFRNADLHTYLQARDEAGSASTLTHNQRASAGLLAAQNALFGINPQAFMLPGLDYHPVDLGRKPRADFDDRSGAARAPLQLWRLPRGADGQPLPKKPAMQAAMEACAGEIARLIGAARDGRIGLGGRDFSAGDIAVLVRSHAQGAAMRRALARAGVASVELSQASVFDSPEAADLERLLAAILEPTRAPLLRAALATELMGLDAAALLAVSNDEAMLLDCIARFAGYRDTWLRRGVGLMLRRWNRDEGVSGRLLALPDGERRLTNLRHLSELLHEAAATHAAPEALLRWLQAQRSDAGHDDATQLRLESDRDLVQVVTVHKSKGLEYPVVFCPLLWDGQGSRSRGGDGLEYHDPIGDAVIDFRPLDKTDRQAIDEQLRLERDAETMRLIYVALTRAVQRCYLVVGSYRRKHGKHWSSTESCRARLNWLVAGAGLSPPQWTAHDQDPADIDAAWAALAQQRPGLVALDALPQGPLTPLAPPDLDADRLAALPPPARIPRGWWIGSYSSLAHGTRHEAAALDHDLRVPATAAAESDAMLDADDILRFPRGASAGECLHAVFERIDFGDAASWPAAVQVALQRFARALPGQDASTAWPQMLLRMLHDVLHTTLPGGVRLAQVPPQRRQTEMEFHLPAPRLDAADLSAWLQHQGLAMAPLAFGTLQGYLRGFIDLVFEHGGRHYVLDWKSNHLGDSVADYGPDSLARAMQQQGYHLQAQLYALALHRHLQRRVPDYRHDDHFGGVLYLFVRGVRPGWTLPDGTAAGVHAQRPSLQALEQLSSLLAGERLSA